MKLLLAFLLIIGGYTVAKAKVINEDGLVHFCESSDSHTSYSQLEVSSGLPKHLHFVKYADSKQDLSGGLSTYIRNLEYPVQGFCSDFAEWSQGCGVQSLIKKYEQICHQKIVQVNDVIGVLSDYKNICEKTAASARLGYFVNQDAYLNFDALLKLSQRICASQNLF